MGEPPKEAGVLNRRRSILKLPPLQERDTNTPHKDSKRRKSVRFDNSLNTRTEYEREEQWGEPSPTYPPDLNETASPRETFSSFQTSPSETFPRNFLEHYGKPIVSSSGTPDDYDCRIQGSSDGNIQTERDTLTADYLHEEVTFAKRRSSIGTEMELTVCLGGLLSEDQVEFCPNTSESLPPLITGSNLATAERLKESLSDEQSRTSFNVERRKSFREEMEMTECYNGLPRAELTRSVAGKQLDVSREAIEEHMDLTVCHNGALIVQSKDSEGEMDTTDCHGGVLSELLENATTEQRRKSIDGRMDMTECHGGLYSELSVLKDAGSVNDRDKHVNMTDYCGGLQSVISVRPERKSLGGDMDMTDCYGGLQGEGRRESLGEVMGITDSQGGALPHAPSEKLTQAEEITCSELEEQTGSFAVESNIDDHVVTPVALGASKEKMELTAVVGGVAEAPVLPDVTQNGETMEYTQLLGGKEEKPNFHFTLNEFLSLCEIRFYDNMNTNRRTTLGTERVCPTDTLFQRLCLAAIQLPELKAIEKTCSQILHRINGIKSDVDFIVSEMQRKTPDILFVLLEEESSQKTELLEKLRELKSYKRLEARKIYHQIRLTLEQELHDSFLHCSESLKADCEVYNSEFVELLRAKNTALDAYVDSLEKELASFQSAILSPEQYEQLNTFYKSACEQEEVLRKYDKALNQLEESHKELSSHMQSLLADKSQLEEKLSQVQDELNGLEILNTTKSSITWESIVKQQITLEILRGVVEHKISAFTENIIEFVAPRFGSKLRIELDTSRITENKYWIQNIKLSFEDHSTTHSLFHQLYEALGVPNIFASYKDTSTLSELVHQLDFFLGRIYYFASDFSKVSVFKDATWRVEGEKLAVAVSFVEPIRGVKVLLKFLNATQLVLDTGAIDYSLSVFLGSLDQNIIAEIVKEARLQHNKLSFICEKIDHYFKTLC